VSGFNRLIAALYRAGDTTPRICTVEGYYTDESRPMLVSDLSALHKNFLLPDSAYILLQGKGVDSIRTTRTDRQNHKPPGPYETAYVSIDIRVKLPYLLPDKPAAIPKMAFWVDQRPRMLRPGHNNASLIE
jgi:hypothetical protein